MERTLVLSVFVVGWLGWLFGLLGSWTGRATAGARRASMPRGLLATCVLIPLVVFLATLPEHGAFAPGQGFGRGFVIGAIGALLAAWSMQRAQASGATWGDSLQSVAVTTAPYFMAAVATAIPLLWLHMVLTDALLGVAIGWFVNSFLLLLAPSRDGRATALTIGAGYAATLAISVALGDYRGGVRFAAGITPVSWRAIVLTFGGCIPFLMLLCSLPAAWIAGALGRLPLSGMAVRLGDAATRDEAARRTLARVWRLLPAGVLLLMVARLLATRLDHHPPLLTLTAIGLCAATLTWWLTDRDEGDTTDANSQMLVRQQNAALAVLVVLCATMAAYQMYEGVGIGLVLLTAWLVAGLLQNGGLAATSAENGGRRVDNNAPETMNCLPTLLIFGLLVEIYRFVTVRYGLDLRGITLADHYALFGFVIGAIVPSALAGYVAKEGVRRGITQGEAIGRAIIAGAIVLAVPFLLLLLFGAKCELAILFGLAVGAVLPTLQRSSIAAATDDGRAGLAALSGLLPSLLALAIGLALAQWTHHVLPLALYARARKLRVVGYVVGALIGLLLASDIYTRLRGGRPGGLTLIGPHDATGRAAR